MHEVRSDSVETTKATEYASLVLVTDEELELTPAAATVLARLVRAYLDAKRAAA